MGRQADDEHTSLLDRRCSMLCPECGLVTGPGPLDARRLSLDDQDKKIRWQLAVRAFDWLRSLLSGRHVKG